MIIIPNTNWFYHKIFIIDNKELFDKFKQLLKNRNIINLRNEFEERDFNKFKFNRVNKDKCYYRITSKSSYGSGSLSGYKRFEEYYEYQLIYLNDIDKILSCINYEDLGLFKHQYKESDYIIKPEYISIPRINPLELSEVNLLHSLGVEDWIDNNSYQPLSQENINSNNKKEDKENIMKLLEIYKDRKTEQIYKVESEKKEEIRLKDKDYAAYKKLNNDKINFIGDFSDDIKKQFAEVEAETKLELSKVECMIREVEAQLEICESYEQKVSVLKLYNILDEEGKLSI